MQTPETAVGAPVDTVFTVRNQTTAVRAPQRVHDWLQSFLGYTTSKWDRDFRTKKVSFGGEVWNPLYDLIDSEFLTGFLPLVARGLRDKGVTYELVDERRDPVWVDPAADLAWLYPYQREGLARVLAKKRGILQWATAGGKSEAYIGLLRSTPVAQHLFVVHNNQLVYNMSDRYLLRAREHGHDEPEIGFVADGVQDYSKRVTFASFATLAAHIREAAVQKFLGRVDVLTCDEAHTAPALSHTRVISHCRNARWRIGITGTPLGRSDQKSTYTIGLLGPVIHVVSAQELIALGRVAAPDIVYYKFHANELAVTGWPKVKKYGINQNVARNAAVVEATLQEERPFVFIDTLKHGRSLTKELQAHGKTVEFVWGDASTASRMASCERLARGDTDIIVCSDVFTAGIDVPEIGAVVLAAGGKAVIPLLQRIGRGMRVTATKKTFRVIDFDDRHHPTLERHTLERRRAFKKEGYKMRYLTATPVDTSEFGL